MLESEGTVLEIEAGVAYVETSRASACGNCGSKHNCGSTPLMQLLGIEARPFQVLNPIGAEVGERVIIGLEESALLRSSLVAYVVPVVLLIAGAIAGSMLASPFSSDVYAMVGALLGLVAGFGALKWTAGRTSGQDKYRPIILRRAFSSQTVKFREGP